MLLKGAIKNWGKIRSNGIVKLFAFIITFKKEITDPPDVVDKQISLAYQVLAQELAEFA